MLISIRTQLTGTESNQLHYINYLKTYLFEGESRRNIHSMILEYSLFPDAQSQICKAVVWYGKYCTYYMGLFTVCFGRDYELMFILKRTKATKGEEIDLINQISIDDHQGVNECDCQKPKSYKMVIILTNQFYSLKYHTVH